MDFKSARIVAELMNELCCPCCVCGEGKVKVLNERFPEFFWHYEPDNEEPETLVNIFVKEI